MDLFVQLPERIPIINISIEKIKTMELSFQDIIDFLYINPKKILTITNLFYKNSKLDENDRDTEINNKKSQIRELNIWLLVNTDILDYMAENKLKYPDFFKDLGKINYNEILKNNNEYIELLNEKFNKIGYKHWGFELLYNSK